MTASQTLKIATLCCIPWLALPVAAQTSPVAAIQSGLSLPSAQADYRASFTIGFEGLTSNLNIMTTTIMPGEIVRVETLAEARAEQGTLTPSETGWDWTAPSEPGLNEILFTLDGSEIRLNVFVLTPYENGVDTEIRGYKIGAYTKVKYKGMDSYSEPRGFIDLSHGGKSLKVAPHFTLGQFLCKQQPNHDPTFLLVRPATLIKLETLLEAANAKGWKADSFHVMSGFRTPTYNRGIGNKTTSSRHLYGGAADIWLDGDGDGQMDDLNGDGKIDKNDARALAKLGETLAKKGGPNWPSGGIGVYGSNAAHGPFVHIDARGFQARWGQ